MIAIREDGSITVCKSKELAAEWVEKYLRECTEEEALFELQELEIALIDTESEEQQLLWSSATEHFEIVSKGVRINPIEVSE